MQSLHCWKSLLLACCLASGIAGIRSTSAQEVDPDEAKEKSVIDRFVVVLEKNPRRGTALDKVYGFHVERGSLDSLIKGYREKAVQAKGIEAGSAWMMIGLFESLRGQDALAVTAFEQAENLASANYLASYYLGQSLVLVGQPDKAAEALERSISRKPAQADLLDIYQSLGRIYQRAQKTDKALDVWNRLEKQFPNDARVQEQIATTLLEENEFAAALPRFENLAKTTKDKYRQSLFQMEVAEIKVRLGKSDEAIKDYEKLLGQLLPENWLYREVRRRIEAVYMRTDDQAGLIAYYETWIKRNENDVEAISRLSRLLSGFGRSADARQWLERGLKVAPKNKELRHALIGMLVFEHKTSEAIVQYEQLDKYEPNNSDTLREWGRLILKDKTLDEGSRKTAAAAVWRRLSEARPKDPLIASQVGELFRQSEMTDEALTLYKKAISLAPEQSQYREYLGEYLHTLNRKDEALSTWRAIADGTQKTAPNLARLAEVLANFGYLAEAVETNAEACQLDPKDFLLQVKRVDLLAQAEKHDKALEQLAVVRKLAANEEEREACLVRELRELQSLSKLNEHIADLKKKVDDPQSASSEDADQWFQLARANEAARQLNDASRAIAKAITLAPQSIPILTASARIHEAQNNLLAASDINRKLAQIDRRYRTEYLKQVAALEQKLGRRDKALQAGRDLVAAAPGNTEMSEFFSQLCFQLGENEEGLNALRRSVRVNPTDPKGMLLLASALGEQFRTSEAIELYWRAFEKAANLDDRLSIIPKLTDLYLQTNQFDRMIERLERQRREPNQNREMTICLAQAYQSVGDDGNARQELEKLLTEETRDIPLLSQLVKLCEAGGDLEAAVKFQQQLLKIVPGKEETMRLAQLLMKSGETEEAKALMGQSVVDEKDPNAALKSIDSLLNQGNNDQALAMIQKLTAEQPQNWDLLYREGVALAKSKDKSAEAKSRFEAILALNSSDDEESLLVKTQVKKGQGTQAPQQLVRAPKTVTQRTQTATQIRQTVGLLATPGTVTTLGSASTRSIRTAQPMSWTPQDFGDARMASLGWLNVLARIEGKEKEETFLNERRAIGEKSENIRELMDWLYLAQLTNYRNDIYVVLKKLSQRPDAEVWIKAMYLTYLTWRAGPPVRVLSNVAPGPDDDADPMPRLVPLENEELEHALACLKAVDDAGTQLSSTSTYLQMVTTELKRSGRKDQAADMLNAAIETSVEPARIAALLPELVQRNDFKNSLKVIDRLAEFKSVATGLGLRNANGSINYSQYAMQPIFQSQILGQLMDKRAQKNELGDVLMLWDRYVPVVVARLEQQRSLNAATKKPTQSSLFQMSQTGSVNVWRNGIGRGEALDFPTENEVYDRPTIQLLHQMLQIYKEATRTSELVSHFHSKQENEKTPVAQKPIWHFGLGYLNWWLGEKGEAVRILSEATESMPDNQEMKFELARLYEKTGEHGRALELIDSLTPTDQRAMQNREITALRMAVNSGNVDRARTAAERLFGLRLDSKVQIQLAQQMRQLGMHEQAEAVLARAGRQAGNKTDVLLTLMQEYQTQGKNDVATQIAYQLLRRSGNNSGSALFSGRVTTGTTTRTISANGRVTTIVNNANDTRQQALSVLKKSGKLPEMIKKVETQLQNAPNSQRLIETLIEYATANGDNKKVEELTAKIAESKKNDPQFQFNLGQQLAQQRKHSEAIVYFKAAIAKDPTLLQTGYSQLYQTFQNTDQLNDIVTLVEGLDTTVAENLRPISYFLQEMSRGVLTRDSTSENRKSATIRLLKKAWAAYPDQRQQFIAYIQGDWFWQMPEMYDYAREAILPPNSTLTGSNSWHGFGRNMVRNAEGKVNTLMTRLLKLAASQKKLDELATDVAAAQAKVPYWDGGIALMALIDLRRGNPEQAIPALESLLPKAKTSSAEYVVLWEIGQELMQHTSSIDLAIRYLEAAMLTTDSISFSGLQWSPMKPLIALYQQRGRMEDARKLVLSVGSRIQTSRNSGNENQEAYQRIRNCVPLVNEIKEMGFPMGCDRTSESSSRQLVCGVAEFLEVFPKI